MCMKDKKQWEQELCVAFHILHCSLPLKAQHMQVKQTVRLIFFFWISLSCSILLLSELELTCCGALFFPHDTGECLWEGESFREARPQWQLHVCVLKQLLDNWCSEYCHILHPCETSYNMSSIRRVTLHHGHVHCLDHMLQITTELEVLCRCWYLHMDWTKVYPVSKGHYGTLWDRLRPCPWQIEFANRRLL